MSDLPSILNDANPEGTPIIGKKALNLTRNILQNIDLSAHSANDILAALRDNNIMVTIPAFFNAYTEITGTKTRAQRIKYYNQQYTPKEEVLEPALYALPTRYRIIHFIKYEDLETGLTIEREFALDTNVLSSIEDMQQQVIDAVESRYPAQVIEIHTIRGYIYESR